MLSDQTSPYVYNHIHSFIFKHHFFHSFEEKKNMSYNFSAVFSRIREVTIQEYWAEPKCLIAAELCGRCGGSGYGESQKSPVEGMGMFKCPCVRTPAPVVWGAYRNPHRASAFSLFPLLKNAIIFSASNNFFF